MFDEINSLKRLENWKRVLSETYGTPFRCWNRTDQGWSTLDFSTRTGTELADWFTEVAGMPDSEPRVRTLSHGATFVATAMTPGSGEALVLCGELATDLEMLGKNLFLAARRVHEVERDVCLQQELLNDYATKLSDSFEEMTFLCRLSRHMEYCDTGRTLGDVAGKVLPQLLQLMEIEGLALVSAVWNDGTQRYEAGRRLLQVGIFRGFADDWCRLVNRHTPEQAGVIVRNYENGLTSVCPGCVDGINSLVIAPVSKEGVVFGWLVGVNKKPRVLSLDAPSNSLGDGEIGSIESSLLEAAASMLAAHGSNSRLFHEKEELLVNIVSTLVGVIEAKDPYTCGHSDRVALIGKRLARELGFPDEFCEDIFLSGLLHDIGKVGISDDVLLKPGRLTDEEFAQIKRHPETGARLLRGLKPFERLIPGVLHHHEALDGSGYPHGLKGDAIPLMARILAVADGYDAMTSDRPYRSGMPLAKAEGILRDGAGTQWDPAIIEAYFSARDDVLRIATDWRNHLAQILAPREASAHDPVIDGALKRTDRLSTSTPARPDTPTPAPVGTR